MVQISGQDAPMALTHVNEQPAILAEIAAP